ncbi:hypothetical protein KSS87_005496 [Heliosperma pusillum]|nr:hypothetical protein KSS87_005496 [Heliosperma pusillum]
MTIFSLIYCRELSIFFSLVNSAKKRNEVFGLEGREYHLSTVHKICRFNDAKKKKNQLLSALCIGLH